MYLKILTFLCLASCINAQFGCIPVGDECLFDLVDRMKMTNEVEKLADVCLESLDGQIKRMIDNRNSIGEPAHSDPSAPDDKFCEDLKKLNKRQINPDVNSNKCIPLVGNNPVSNPYHNLLTGMDSNNVVVRQGLGNAYNLISTNGLRCPDAASRGCSLQYSVTTTVSHTNSLSISTGDTVAYASTNSSSWGTQNSTSHINIISGNLEFTIQNTTSKENRFSNSTMIQRAIENGTDWSHENSHTRGYERQVTNTTSWENERSGSNTRDGGWENTVNKGSDSTIEFGGERGRTTENTDTISETMSCDVTASRENTNGFNIGAQVEKKSKGLYEGGFNIGFTDSDTNGKSITLSFSVSVSKAKSRGGQHTNSCRKSTITHGMISNVTRGGWSRTRGWAKRNGGSIAIMEGHSESDTESHRNGGHTSETLTNGFTTENGWANTRTDMYGRTIGHSRGKNTEKGKVDNRNQELSDTKTITQQTTITRENSTTVSRAIEVSTTINIDANNCVIPICRPTVKSMVIPYICTGNEPGEIVYYNAEVQSVDKYDENKVSCIVTTMNCGEKLPAYEPYTRFNSLHSFRYPKEVFYSKDDKDSILIVNDLWSLKFIHATKQLGLYHGPHIRWRTGDYTLSNSKFSITDNGHIVLWGQGVYIDSDKDWTPVWSSQPINHVNFQVGVLGPKGYTLYLSDTGELSLYDSNYAKVWSNIESIHRFGYKFPIDSLYPSVNPTDRNFQGQIDVHNSLPVGATWLDTNKLEFDCSKAVLKERHGLVSPNKRFRLYMSPTGNLIMYDGERIMWQSKTNSLWYTKGPYRAILHDSGRLTVKDSRNLLIWSTQGVGFTTFEINDDGQMVGMEDDEMIWNLSDGESGWMVYGNPLMSCDSCTPCSINYRMKKLIHLATNTSLEGDYLWNAPTYKYIGENGQTLLNMTWMHYTDGFLTGMHSSNTCLGVNGSLVQCTQDKLRIDKLWSHGPMVIDKLDTAPYENRFMLVGHTMSDNTTIVNLTKNGSIVINDKVVHAMTRELHRGGPVLELKEENDYAVVQITNLYSNYTYHRFKSSKGQKPFTLMPRNGALIVRGSDKSKGALLRIE